MLLVFAAAQAHAKASVVCVEKMNTNVDHKGTDGSECFAGSDGSGVVPLNKLSGLTTKLP